MTTQTAETTAPAGAVVKAPPDLVLGEAPDWVAAAVCASTDPEAFFPEKGGSTRSAKAICGRCTVAAECLTYALAHDERFGIWGGLSERDRRALNTPAPRRRARAKRAEITDTLLLTVLKLLADGRDTAFAAAACGLTEDKVSQIAADYGHPDDPTKTGWGIEARGGMDWQLASEHRTGPAQAPVVR